MAIFEVNVVYSRRRWSFKVSCVCTACGDSLSDEITDDRMPLPVTEGFRSKVQNSKHYEHCAVLPTAVNGDDGLRHLISTCVQLVGTNWFLACRCFVRTTAEEQLVSLVIPSVWRDAVRGSCFHYRRDWFEGGEQ